MARKRRTNKKKGLGSTLQINSSVGRKVKSSTRITTTVGKLRRIVNAAKNKKNPTTTIRFRRA